MQFESSSISIELNNGVQPVAKLTILKEFYKLLKFPIEQTKQFGIKENEIKEKNPNIIENII